MPNLAGATEWLSRNRDLGPRYLAENRGQRLQHVAKLQFTYLLGLAAIGYISAANTLMGPLRIIFAGDGPVHSA